MTASEVDHAAVRERFGLPQEQIGSVNDPRTHEEHGVRWNEKWIYRGEDGRTIERVVLWNRYDLAGVFRLAADGKAEPEAIPEG